MYTKFEVETLISKGGEIGIGMGIARFATLSTAEYFKPINCLKTKK